MCASHLRREEVTRRGGENIEVSGRFLTPWSRRLAGLEREVQSQQQKPLSDPALLAVRSTVAHGADHRAPGLGVPVDSLS